MKPSAALRAPRAQWRVGARRARAAPGRLGVVGGAVRDALLGRRARVAEIDVVVEGDPEPVARALGEVVAWHERFNTYDVVTPDGAHADVVMARAERYAAPGALPDVRPSGPGGRPAAPRLHGQRGGRQRRG